MIDAPIARKFSRENYKHAWAEPVYSLISQSSMNENCWWERHSNLNSGVFWSKVKL